MSSQISKLRVASSFSKAANSYDGSAQLQRDVGYQLLKLGMSHSVIHMQRKNRQMLDLGSGTGYFSEKLTEHYPEASLCCLDIAQGMLEHARALRGTQTIQWLCADAEALPIASNSVDFIFSSLAIQWCENLNQLFSEISRVLKPGAVALISTLGPGSLKELRNSWAKVDAKVHVNQFEPLSEVLSCIAPYLSVELCHKQWHKLEYNKLQQLTTDIKNIGAHNMNAGEAKGLTGRAKVKQFKHNYEAYRQANGTLPASYEVYYLCLRKD